LALQVHIAVAMATIKNPEDLAAWQLASALKKRVCQILKRSQVAKDFKFCDQIRRSARSAPANLAEGLGRQRPRDNARFVRIALGSLRETWNHRGDGHDEDYIDDREFEELRTLCESYNRHGRSLAQVSDKLPGSSP